MQTTGMASPRSGRGFSLVKTAPDGFLIVTFLMSLMMCHIFITPACGTAFALIYPFFLPYITGKTQQLSFSRMPLASCAAKLFAVTDETLMRILYFINYTGEHNFLLG